MKPSNQLSLLSTPALGDADFSPCRKYRYTLWRRWCDDWQSDFCMFICLNPSTADEVQNDPTVTRCINYSKSWGYSAFLMTNLFGYRATDPKDMKAVAEPVGEENDRYLLECATRAKIVIAAWGVHGKYKGRDKEIMGFLPKEKLHYLKLTTEGIPSHPLYLKKDLKPTHFI